MLLKRLLVKCEKYGTLSLYDVIASNNLSVTVLLVYLLHAVFQSRSDKNRKQIMGV